jgi:hypothetical protein
MVQGLSAMARGLLLHRHILQFCAHVHICVAALHVVNNDLASIQLNLNAEKRLLVWLFWSVLLVSYSRFRCISCRPLPPC